MAIFGRGIHDFTIKFLGYYLIFQAGRITFTDYVVLESMNQELNKICENYHAMIQEDFQKVVTKDNTKSA
ncbi:hypothetical protein SteCoe_15117 [Stentor coeruleus]|uniref:Uncharacterized protein n=1 Tax=Stentor coeruleus TaxID=5963 RepID=A0A1R2C4D5_9CILI|nr:hypothetical protein SteCoe_15117 [Stentor coeruleus]